MNVKVIFKTIGKLLLVEAIMLCLPLIVALIYHEYNYILPFVIPIAILLILGLILSNIIKDNSRMYAKEGFAVVGLSWIFMSLFGALPFTISGIIPNYIDALFETVSGFTTTGSSIISNIDTWYDSAKSLLFWRSFTHWIGGMGVLVFVIAILPKDEGHNIHIIKAEATGPKVGKLVSKVKITARILYLIYFSLTILLFILLLFDPKMSPFDSMIHAFGTAGTGGFGIRSESVGYYSVYSQVIISIFMLIFGVNFNLYYLILIGNFKQVFKNEEFKWYISIVIISTLVIGIDIFLDTSLTYSSIALALKDSFFQVSSIMTTTGFAVADFAKWSTFSKMLLLTLMFIGGCAGSTGGGLKVSRIVILLKSAKRELKKIVHPRSVSNIKMDNATVDESVVKGVNNYFVIIMLIFIISIIIVSLDPNILDLSTVISSVAACLNNIGPGLSDMIGPFGNYGDFSWFSKLTLIITMLIGRLEIYPILLIFNIKNWLKR
ncbi:MAG: TrkH family potassium uptake protein [Erysipelotrichaceae bacterium]|nr:TrkH family potassium uptake protein [Erysipelotrichaceae bacterium]